MYFIFRKSDKVHLYTAQSRPGSLETEWVACLANEGGVAADYVEVEAEEPIPPGMVAALYTDPERVVYIPNPKRVALAEARSKLSDKLITMGLTEAEANMLTRYA